MGIPLTRKQSVATVEQPEAGGLSSAEPHLSVPQMSAEQYRRLAEFRYQMRRFLHFSQDAAVSAGLQAKQYQLLQVIAGIPEDMSPTIAAVASRTSSARRQIRSITGACCCKLRLPDTGYWHRWWNTTCASWMSWGRS
jgi:hypothetical protein